MSEFQLPEFRVNKDLAFTSVGIDFAGHLCIMRYLHVPQLEDFILKLFPTYLAKLFCSVSKGLSLIEDNQN